MHPAGLDESKLLAGCQIRRQRRSGPGGQHRNKVETAVIIEHTATGIRGEASERRSQEENRQRALWRLRINLALAVRQPCDPTAFIPSEIWSKRCHGGRLTINPTHDDFPSMLAEALDVLAASGMDVKQAAQSLACSPSQLIKFLWHEPEAMAQVNAHRLAAGKRYYQ